MQLQTISNSGYEGIIKRSTELSSYYFKIIYAIKIHAELHKLSTYANSKVMMLVFLIFLTFCFIFRKKQM